MPRPAGNLNGIADALGSQALSRVSSQLDRILQSQQSMESMIAEMRSDYALVKRPGFDDEGDFSESSIGVQFDKPLAVGLNGNSGLNGMESLEIESPKGSRESRDDTDDKVPRASAMTKVKSAMTKTATEHLEALRQRRVGRLKRILDVHAEYVRQTEQEEEQIKTNGWWSELRSDMRKLEHVFDAFGGILIVFNMMFIAMTLDVPDDEKGVELWWLNVSFAACFTVELALQLLMKGPREIFCGRDKYANIFNFTLVISDDIQLLISTFVEVKVTFLADLFRVLRLLRLLRVLRLIRLPFMHDLIAMVTGLVGSLTTLGVSILLFLFMVFVVALVCREVLGSSEDEKVAVYFNSVPRSMFTVFRCSFGDCSNDSGIPIWENVWEGPHGSWLSMCYSLWFFCVTIGVFNVISAIFVERTLSTAAEMEQTKFNERLRDEVLWAKQLTMLIEHIFDVEVDTAKIHDHDFMTYLAETEVPRHSLDDLVQDQEVREALNALDIDEHDHRKLSDILDPSHRGAVGVLDLVDGLQRLRGMPRRSDTVTVNLMVRSLQATTEEIRGFVQSIAGVMCPQGHKLP
eukprot:TRINITY_DN55276_c0_g1_i1.p1 TRINITY_DN55276_c0_g1~~TRINITY_DN55276_c0_g1_i1.p1  ORF type:complete len:575 (+),score=104.48 TRINITY_DN55276_c0_g1_i1:70-1794(+)